MRIVDLLGAIATVSVSVVGLYGCTMISGAGDLILEDRCTGVCPSESSLERRTEKDETLPIDAPAPSEESRAPSSSSSSSSGSTTTSVDGGDGIDAKTPAEQDNPVECGATTCHGPTAACCVGDQGSTKTCTTKTAACLGARVECGGRSNCTTGQVCCLDLNGLAKATCTPEADCAGTNQFMFCRTEADCLTGQVCVNTTGSFSEHKGCLTP